MGRLYATPCVQDRDYARFVSYYIAHSYEFDEQYTFHEAVAHLMISLQDSRIMLFDDEEGKLHGFILYRYEAADGTLFIDSTILSPDYRSSIVFYKGFGDWVRHVMMEHSEIRQVRFFVRADHPYLIRLYGKFANRIEEIDRGGRAELVYESAFYALKRYLRV
ncbi:hypothetical protein DFQ01_107154 [Paenibacillus cellulosilyticus]|uniref:N-acetyltransferase domain-containing protein n=1 Tax=Paenibacillus cellulosilyticus TaxID=375489 RepID=A0A2V2YUE9_9BACL|nr:hypothetical protein [Paenibacillus cellulosilyticus]PWW03257.1 hypothetical protein DFQ01_107154 [Paenibacillus cellulosilyticus]QKS43739.1 hypothetical protein HUB94_04300 [Paenibacillus cellulosilyticus]